MLSDEKETYRVSSNLTLFFKIGIPVFWGVFFSAITLGMFLSREEGEFIGRLQMYKLAWLGIFLLFIFLIYFTLLKLKRIELGRQHVYVSNYFKTYRYHFADVEKIKSLDFGLFLILIIRLKNKGKMGRKIPFIASKGRLNNYLNDNKLSDFTSILNK